jgi:acyl transferase domain-containing protein
MTPLAIIGYAIRFPGGATTPDLLWNLLMARGDAIVPIPPDRLPLRYRGASADVPGRTAALQAGILDEIAGFDAGYFGVTPREARLMDPHQRLLLELAIETLERAGIPSASLAGRKVAVVAALPGAHYAAQLSDAEADLHTAVGTDTSIAANRISYMLDLAGPSLTLNTACSSALTSFHLACQAVRTGEAELGIAAAANLLIDPKVHLFLSHAGLLSPDARCRAFDADGRGYVRAEGAAVMLVKRLDRALHDGDPIRAVVLASAINAAGRTAGISLPSEAAQARLLAETYAAAGVDPADVCYVEAHGTGTSAGDPIECAAIGQVLGAAHSAQRRLLIGSIKSNIGHMETAAGFGGMAKAILALEHGVLPPSLHFRTPNPAIDFAGQHLQVVTEPTVIPDADPGIIGVSSFGFGGANAHVALQRAPRHPCRTTQPPVLALPVTARSAAALRASVGQMAAFVAQHGDLDVADIAYTALRRRDLHRNRAVVVADDRTGLLAGLRALAAGDAGGATAEGVSPGKPGKCAFLFTGNGPQWHAMGRELLRDAPLFRRRFAEVEQCFADFAGWRLGEELARDEAASRIARTDIAQPLLFALQLALVAELAGLGIAPDAVLGHSVGEVAAACVAGALDLPQAVRVIHQRSRWQQTTQGAGQMAAVGLSAADAAAWLERHAPEIVVAAENGPRSATLAGSAAALDALEQVADAAGIFYRRLRLDYCFHSPAMEPIRQPLLDALAGLRPSATAIPMVSSVSGNLLQGEALDAEYWWRNVRAPVRFHPAVDHLIATGHDLFIEIGPHPALTGYVTETLTEAGRTAAVFESLRRREPEVAALRRLLARCLASGDHVDRAKLSPAGKVVELPTYPWQREPYWASGVLAEGDEEHPLLGTRLRAGLAQWQIAISQTSHPFLADHVVDGEAAFPTTGYVEMARAAAASLFGADAAELHDLELHQIMMVPKLRPLLVILAVQPDGAFAISSRPIDHPAQDWVRHASGRLAALPEASDSFLKLTLAGGAAAEYGDTAFGGLFYGPGFRLIRSLSPGRDADQEWLVGAVQPATSDGTYVWHPALLDTALQLPWFLNREGPGGVYLPATVRRIRLIHSGAAAAFVCMRVIGRTSHVLRADMRVLAKDGRVLATIDGYESRRITSGLPQAAPGLLHRYRWDLVRRPGGLPAVEPAALLAAAPAEKDWRGEGLAILDRLCGALAGDVLRYLTDDEIDESQAAFARRLAAMAGAETTSVAAAWRAAYDAAPEMFLELELARATAAGLADVLRGVNDAADLPPVGRVAERGLLAAPARSCVAAVVGALLEAWPADRKLRILELGAGRSAVRSLLADLLPSDRCELVVADPAPDLLPQSGVTCLLADPLIASDLARLGSHRFDLVVGNDLVQQADDIDATLVQWRALLAPHGMLLLDLRQAGRFSDLVLGARRGMRWIPPRAWPALLAAAGFAATSMRETQPGLGHILLARNEGPALPPAADPCAMRAFMVVAAHGRAELADRLAAALAARGQTVMLGDDLSAPADEVVYLAPPGRADGPPVLDPALLHLVQALHAAAPSPRLTLVTSQAFAAPGGKRLIRRRRCYGASDVPWAMSCRGCAAGASICTMQSIWQRIWQTHPLGMRTRSCWPADAAMRTGWNSSIGWKRPLRWRRTPPMRSACRGQDPC